MAWMCSGLSIFACSELAHRGLNCFRIAGAINTLPCDNQVIGQNKGRVPFHYAETGSCRWKNVYIQLYVAH